jgi:hypothetical protein
MAATNKVNCKVVTDTNTVITNRPDLGLIVPKIQVGHPNEASHVALVNFAQDPPTIAMRNEAAARANALSAINFWTPSN